MKTISVLEGKNKFSQVVASAAGGEPQIITKNGKETAVVISIDEYRRLSSGGKSLVEVLLDNPARKHGIELDFSRSNDTGRSPIKFDEDD